MNRRAAAVLVTCAALALPAGSLQARRARLSVGPGTANPSALVAREIGLEKRAASKGYADALRDAADDDAVVLGPKPVPVREWLSHAGKAAATMHWDAKSVWMSCDGTLGVTRGIWGDGGAKGTFVRVWKQRKPGHYRWVAFAQSAPQPDMTRDINSDAGPDTKPAGAGAAPGSPAMPGLDMLTASVAQCRRTAPAARPSPSVSLDSRASDAGSGGLSRDGTLEWSYAATRDGATLDVSLRKAGAMVPVLTYTVSATSAATSLPPRGTEAR